ncbi:glycerate kinase [Fictibacillus enclensis]|uniref:glycerate kinase n=1 Tax=Fictibacillus enclensis TaxID=1017270 RepID=UPI0025A29DCD|nr:glycerate kinase [Fictibacillus enclensis]MDM5340477.1 glycerate kinase [Fictibacillus enclensis]
MFPETDYHLLPIADGGEGTVHALASANDTEIESISVTGPLREPVQAKIALTRDGKKALFCSRAVAVCKRETEKGNRTGTRRIRCEGYLS